MMTNTSPALSSTNHEHHKHSHETNYVLGMFIIPQRCSSLFLYMKEKNFLYVCESGKI